MRSLVFAITAAGLLAGGACLAQTTQETSPAGTAPTTPPASMQRPAGAPGSTAMSPQDRNAAGGNNNQAVATTSANARMPAKGSNSFTMGEARSRLQRNGFSNVKGLSKDHNGVWRGEAQKGGSPTSVWLDYKGNIGEGK